MGFFNGFPMYTRFAIVVSAILLHQQSVCAQDVEHVLTSIAAEDGSIRESAAGSGRGGQVVTGASGGATLQIGTDLRGRRYRTILSFNTAPIPVSASVEAAEIELISMQARSQSRINAAGGITADLKIGYFGKLSALEKSDYQAGPSISVAGIAPQVDSAGGYRIAIPQTALKYINRGGRLQLRLSLAESGRASRRKNIFKFFGSKSRYSDQRPAIRILYRKKPHPTPKPKPTATPRPTATPAPTATPTPQPTPTATPKPTATPTPTPTPTATPTPTPTATPTPTPTPTPLPPGEIWRPAPGTSWQWQLTGTIDTSLDVQMYDIDLFDAPQAKIDTLRAQGRIVICYFSAGSWEDWRPDADQFPAEVLGRTNGWPGEKWLDISNLTALAPVMRARLDLAVSKGCDGVEPDNVDGYTNNTGFSLSGADQLAYNRWMAAEAHARGLSIGLKNDLDQVDELVDYYDWALNEQCFEYNECSLLTPFVQAGKAVFGVEYSGSTSTFCPKANAFDFDWLKKNLDLDAYRVACR